MPLGERDVNTQHEIYVPRHKRHSIQPELANPRLRDENSPSLREAGSKTPSQHLLASTKASAAKVASSPRVPSQGTPQSHSKLPLRAQNPSAKQSHPKERIRVADGVASAEQGPEEGGELLGQRSDVVTIRQHQSPLQHEAISITNPLMRKPLPAEKPLPSRPVASFINELSPSKDSRSLLDASEKPLTIVVGGSDHDWPTLTPRSTSAPAIEMLRGTETEKLRQYTAPTMVSSSAAAMVEAATQLTNVIVGKPAISAHKIESVADSERSSSATFDSATDANSTIKAISTGAPTDSIGGDERAQTDFASRKASLRNRISSGNLVTSTLGPRSKLTGFTDFTKHGASPAEDSRPHSPSPASFSRPRPGSSSYARTLPSPSPKVGTATAAKAARAQKTASRIPLPDTKKATLVDIKNRCSSGTQTPKSEKAPSFGTRRLDAPDTLKILDQGIKRRQLTQLKGTDTSSTATYTTYCHTKAPDSVATPVLRQSRSSSPEGTVGTSSSDEEEVATPTEKQPGFTHHALKTDHTGQHSDSYYHATAVRLFDDAVSALGRTPPSTSSFTEPLPTIPSESVLPLRTEDAAPPLPIHHKSPSDFEIILQRFTELHTAHAYHTAGHIGDRAPVPDNTRNSVIELLNEYMREDVRLGQEGCSALDDQARKHITCTLSLLEGKGSPPKTEVDNETLLRMFGHLKRGLDKIPKTASFVQNAAAAKEFVAQATGDVPQQAQVSAEAPLHLKPGPGADEQRVGEYGAQEQLPTVEAVASKWSDSASSLEGVSEDVSLRNTSTVAAKTRHPKAPKRLAPDPPRSIGYPSRIPSKASAFSVSTATPPNVIRRSFSPTLGKSKPGSVRAARETLHQVRGGFARTTASAESKKTVKMPTPDTKIPSLADDRQRGRVPSAEKQGSKHDSVVAPKTPRARSKSRYVLDKINGLFSGKREKKCSPAPPIPSIDEGFSGEHSVEVAANGSPLLKSAKGPSVKMPTISPSNHPAFRTTSRATSNTSRETPVDSVTADDDTQALQNWTASLINRAQREGHPVRKERMLSFAKVLNDSLISAREAQISAETANHAARSAQLSYEMTQKSVAMLQRLATSFGMGGRR